MIETTWELCSHHSNRGFNLVLLSRNDTAFIVAISGCPWSTDKLISVCLQLGSQGVYPLLTPNTKERYMSIIPYGQAISADWSSLTYS